MADDATIRFEEPRATLHVQADGTVEVHDGTDDDYVTHQFGRSSAEYRRARAFQYGYQRGVIALKRLLREHGVSVQIVEVDH